MGAMTSQITSRTIVYAECIPIVVTEHLLKSLPVDGIILHGL